MRKRLRHWTSVGERLRALRKARGWTLAEVSARTGLAISTLSKAERGHMSLTYDRIVQLADGLELDIVELFGRAASPLTSCGVRVTRYGEAPEHNTAYYTYGMASADVANKQMTPMFGRIRAHNIDEFQTLISHPGEEYTIVLEGSVTVYVDGSEPETLDRFDSIYLDSTVGHAYVSAGPEDALVMCICWRPTGAGLHGEPLG
jgi:transcriptional regulator with XRE-family HTH domain